MLNTKGLIWTLEGDIVPNTEHRLRYPPGEAFTDVWLLPVPKIVSLILS